MTMSPVYSSADHTVCVVGAGAVGSFFGAMLHQAGHRVVLVARPDHVQAIQAHGLELVMASGDTKVLSIPATTDLQAVRSASVVLLCVKSYDTEKLMAEVAPWLQDDAVILSMQNGVDNPACITHALQAAGRTDVLVVPTAVYVAAAMPGSGKVTHHGRGDLVIGPLQSLQATQALDPRLQGVQALFAAAQVPVTISSSVMAELWGKLVVNCAYNAASALSQKPYGQIVAIPEMLELLDTVVQEVVAVAQAEGHDITLMAARQATTRIGQTMAGQRSSTAQDIARSKPTEIDYLNGTVVRRGRALGIPVPANQALYALMKLIEAPPRSSSVSSSSMAASS